MERECISAKVLQVPKAGNITMEYPTIPQDILVNGVDSGIGSVEK